MQLQARCIKSHKNTQAVAHISMLVGMSWKLAAILGRRRLQQEFTEGPLCWIFMPGFKVVMAACSRRFSWPLNSEVVRMLVAFQLIAWPCSLPCLAGALLIFPVELSIWLYSMCTNKLLRNSMHSVQCIIYIAEKRTSFLYPLLLLLEISLSI